MMRSQKCYKGVKTHMFPSINFIDTVRDICFPCMSQMSTHLFVKNLVWEVSLCLIQDQSIFSEEK